MAHNVLRKVRQDILDYFIKKQAELGDPVKKDIYFAIMDACLQCRRVCVNKEELYDLRYFYVDQDDIGHFTCGVAFETMISLFREHRLSQFGGQQWYSAVDRSSDDPVVQGFLAEQICLSQIVSCGLLAVNANLGRMSHMSFDEQPNWDDQLSSTCTVRLYIPTGYKFRAVDAVILVVDHFAKAVHMYPIQITLSARRKLTYQDFYGEIWQKWVEPIEKAGFTVESTFVWIDMEQPADDMQPKLVEKLRSGLKTVRPEYRIVHVGIRQVDPKLAATFGP